MDPACLYIGKLLCQMKCSNRGVPLVAVERFEMRFIATFQVNYRNILREVKDVISSLQRFASCLYMGNFYVRCKVIPGVPTDDFGGNLNEIHSQISAKFRNIPLRLMT